jgi:predicted O-methyltransferase YrrM
MAREIWSTVDNYLADLFVGEDTALDAALEASRAAGLPEIQVSPCQGKLLMLLALTARAERILEVGTLGGYSTIWLARGLAPGGRLVTLEISERHAAVARENLRRADLSEVVELRVGPAAESLRQLVEEGRGPFDLIFLDADKPSNPEYLAWSLKLSHSHSEGGLRSGTLIVADNVVREGKVLDAAGTDAAIQGIRLFNQQLAAEPRVQATVIQTVGVKGYDGFAVARVR